MGKKGNICKACVDQEEIRAESGVANHIVTKTDNLNKDKILKTSQKSTNHTATTSQTNNRNKSFSSKKIQNQKYKRN